jgi:UDP-3-O-[3-hydroxymyristoyl] glucosamine N-acyltransferase
MTITASQLAALLGGTIEGNPEASVSRPMPIEEAQNGDFAFLDNPKYEQYAYTTQASILMVARGFAPTQPIAATLLRVDDVRAALVFLLAKFGEGNAPSVPEISAQAAIHATAVVGEGSSVGAFSVIEAGARIGVGCTIYPQVYIGKNTVVGDHSILYPGVRLYHDVEVGHHCIIHANAVIGADGFGYAPQPDGSWKKIPQVGNVVLGNYVEIGANTCIDRAALGSTTVREGAKLDNLVHIAHGVEVGAHTAMAAQVGVAGSATIGPHCQLGGQAGVAGHISIAKGTLVQAQSGLASSIKEEGTAVFGSPAIPYGDYVRAYIIFKELPALSKRLRAVENGNM